MAVERFGGIDVLHNNAGIVDLMPLAEQTESQINRLMQVNCVAQIHTIQRVVPEMQGRGAGSIITSPRSPRCSPTRTWLPTRRPRPAWSG